MTTDIQKLDPDAAIDLAYDIFLEMLAKISIPLILYSSICNLKIVVRSSLLKLPMIGNKKLGC